MERNYVTVSLCMLSVLRPPAVRTRSWLTSAPSAFTSARRCCAQRITRSSSYFSSVFLAAEFNTDSGASSASLSTTGNERVPTQLVQCWGPIYKISYDNLTIILRSCQSYDRLTTDVAYNLSLLIILRRARGFS